MFSKFAKITPVTWGVIAALLIFGIVLFAITKDKKRWTARMLANAALCIALATVLSFVRLYKMPQGGSITPASMLPLFLFAWGLIPGIILGTFGRFVCVFVSGVIFFGMYAPEGQNVLVYSAVYNGLYLVPEAIICIVLAMIPQIRQLAKRLALQA